MSAYNEADPLGIGLVAGPAGLNLGSVGGADFSLSTQLLTQPAYRSKLLAACVGWLQSHRGTAARPSHTYDELLEGALMDRCEMEVADSLGNKVALSQQQRAQLVAQRLAELTQPARNKLFLDLRANPKVLVTDGDHVAYRATHPGLYDRAGLLRYVAQFKHGMPQEELADAYPGVMDDIAALLASGDLYSLAYVEKNRTVLFPRDRSVDCPVDADLKAMWAAVQMPRSVPELEEALWQAGHLSREQYKAGHLEKSRANARGVEQAKAAQIQAVLDRKAKRKKYPHKITNTHLVGTFAFLTPGGGKPAAGGAPAAK